MPLEWITEPGVHPNALEFFANGGKHGILITHGLSGSLYHYRGIAERFVEEGFSVRGVRLPGHGTHPDQLLSVTIQDFHERVAAGFEELLKTCETVSLLGGSFGGNLFLDLATQHPASDRIHRIAVLDIPVILPGAWWYRRALGVARRIRPYYIKPWTKHEQTNGDFFTEHGSYLKMPFTVIQQFHAFIEKITKKQLDRVTQPVLILQSDHDTVVSPSGARWLQNHLRNTHSELRWIPSSDHTPILSMPATFQDMIIRFFQKELY